MTKIVFLGSGTYGSAALAGLLANYDVKIVFTHSADDAVIKNINEIPYVISNISNGLDICSYINRIVDVAPDFIVSTNWRRKIDDVILKIPKYAALNVHDSLLPKYAGLSSEHWVIRNDEPETGVTVHIMTEEMDAGGIVLQEKVKISRDDVAIDIVKKQWDIYPSIIVRAIEFIKANQTKITSIPKSKYQRYHKITTEDLRVNWKDSPRRIYDMVRAHSEPYDKCYFILNDLKYKIRSACLQEMSYCGIPGRVVSVLDKGVAIATGVDELQTPQSGITIIEVENDKGTVIDANKVVKLNHQLT